MMEKNDDMPKVVNENHMENCNVFQGPIYGATFPLPGANVTIHNHYDSTSKAKHEVSEGQTESTEDRQRRKEAALEWATSKLEFDDSMLAYDNHNRPITNHRLKVLLRMCLGVGSHPTPDNKLIIEQLWVLLMDNRNQCSKVQGEPAYRQTVLNIVGHFMAMGLIVGMPQKVAQCMFPDIDQNKVKNLTRAIPDSFPQGTTEMLNHYINRLKNGEF